MAAQAFPWRSGGRLGKATLSDKLFSLTYAQPPEEAFPLQPHQQRGRDGDKPQLALLTVTPGDNCTKREEPFGAEGQDGARLIMNCWQILSNKNYHSRRLGPW